MLKKLQRIDNNYKCLTDIKIYNLFTINLVVEITTTRLIFCMEAKNILFMGVAICFRRRYN